jgi:hypothetical protein
MFDVTVLHLISEGEATRSPFSADQAAQMLGYIGRAGVLAFLLPAPSPPS